MADEYDMWEYLEWLEEQPGREDEYKKLFACWNARYNEYDPDRAEELKAEFREEFGYWNNWY